ncbi:hypothetical protein [Culicoidibacter larvae]|uniref:MarR family transcriptional regulator n=1 Tax=Culicoidibacter larvae TaxID=2579976 RepID=A0A5R8QH39_9FIRM|nr:hypothetical protein [Culicoidibacter larvae]TLG77349.1 hypothetical protein FEZ08_01650 [Culicoidibacter larvae]
MQKKMFLTKLELEVFGALQWDQCLKNEEIAERIKMKKQSVDNAVGHLYKYGLIKDTYNYRRGQERIIKVIGVVDFTSGAVLETFLD